MANEPYVYDDLEDEGGSSALPAQLRDPFGVLRRQIGWILASLTLLLVLTGVASLLVPLKYEARATILLSAKSIPDEYVPDTIIATIREQFETIRGEVFSRDELVRIIGETGLYEKDRETVPMAEKANRLRQELKVNALYGVVHSARSVAFEIKMAGHEPELLATVVNTTVAKLINANVEYRSRQARLTTRFMQREFERADETLRAHQRRLAEFRAEHRGSLPEEREAAISKLERLEEQRRTAILRLNDYRAQIERIEQRGGGQEEVDTLDILRARLHNAESIYTPEHPTVLSLRRQVEALEANDASREDRSPSYDMLEERASVAKGMELEQLRLSQIDEEAVALEARLAEAPKIADEYGSLVREEKILQENYVDYLRKLKSAELALSLESAQQGAQLTLTETAMPPTRPAIPRWLFAAAGVVLSIGLALVVGVGRELLHPVIVDEQHLEDALSVPALGSVARIA